MLKVGEGKSAMVDFTIHDNSLKRIALIEFKALTPVESEINKDFCKLKYESLIEKCDAFFVMLVKNNKAIDKLKERIRNAQNIQAEIVSETVRERLQSIDTTQRDYIQFVCWDLEHGENIEDEILGNKQ